MENIPVLSYVMQRGRCRHCGGRVSFRYPVVELATAVLFAATVIKFGVSLEALVFAGFFWVLVVLTMIDLEHKLLPNRIVYPAFAFGWAALGLTAAVGDDAGRLSGAALGALVFGGFLFVVAFVYPAGMGAGDVKLALLLGTFLGYLGGLGLVLAGMFFSFVVGGVVGVVVLVTKGGTRKTQLPFGPALALGAVAAILFGQTALDIYLRSFQH